jgi:hypothetical protein
MYSGGSDTARSEFCAIEGEHGSLRNGMVADQAGCVEYEGPAYRRDGGK